MNALADFEKPIVVAVQGAAIGGGTTMLPHCDFVYAARARGSGHPSSIWPWCRNLARAARFRRGSSPPGRGAAPAGLPLDAKRAAELGLVSQVVSDQALLATASEAARKLAAKPAGALQASKRLLKRSVSRPAQGGNEGRERRVQRASPLCRRQGGFTASLEKRPPSFNRTATSATAA